MNRLQAQILSNSIRGEKTNGQFLLDKIEEMDRTVMQWNPSPSEHITYALLWDELDHITKPEQS